MSRINGLIYKRSRVNGLIPTGALDQRPFMAAVAWVRAVNHEHRRHRLPLLSRMSRHASPRLAGPPRSRRVVSKRALWLLAILVVHERPPLMPRLAGPSRSRRAVSKRALWLLACLSMHERPPLIRLSFYTKDLWPGRRRRRAALLPGRRRACLNMLKHVRYTWITWRVLIGQRIR